MANDLGAILQGIGQYIQGVQSDRTDVAGKLEENQRLRQEGVNAVKTAVDLTQQVEQADLDQQLQMEKRKKATAAAFGTDILDPENRIAMLAREQAASVDEALARSKRGSELVDMNFWDSPLEYMVARPFASREFNAAATAQARAQFLDKSIMDLNQQTQATVQTQQAINENLNADEAAARAQLAKLKAEDAVRLASINANNLYVADLKTLRGMDEEGLRWGAEAYKLTRHEQEFQAKMAEMKAAREARQAAKKGQDEEIDYLMTRYNLGADLLGRAKAVSRGDFLNMLKFNKKHVVEIAEQGESVWIDPNDPAGTTVLAKIAPTPGQAAVKLSYFQGNLRGAERTTDLLRNVQVAAMENLKKTTQGKIGQEELASEMNKMLLGYERTEGKSKTRIPGMLEQMAGNAEQDAGRIKNVFRAPDINTMATVAPALANNPLYKDIIMPAATASGPSPTVDAIVRQAKLSISEGKTTPEAAADYISTYFGTALRANNTNEKLFMVGVPEKFTKAYPAQVETYSRMMGKSVKTIDATNPEHIKHYLLSEAASTKLGTTLGKNGGTFGFN